MLIVSLTPDLFSQYSVCLQWSVTIDNENDEVPRLADGVIITDSFYADVSEVS